MTSGFHCYYRRLLTLGVRLGYPYGSDFLLRQTQFIAGFRTSLPDVLQLTPGEPVGGIEPA